MLEFVSAALEPPARADRDEENEAENERPHDRIVGGEPQSMAVM